jgi:hypothetical protein
MNSFILRLHDCSFFCNVDHSDIGRFTIIDNAKVNDEDTASNFFVDEASKGQSRASTVSTLLQGEENKTAVHVIFHCDANEEVIIHL